MHDPDPRPVWFVGDLDDPWVAAVAEALPLGTVRLHAPGDLPETFAAPAPRAVVLHRAVLTRHDFGWVERLKQGQAPPRLVLCFGPHARQGELERWGAVVDAAVPEATARETVARRLDPSWAVVGRRPAEAVRGRPTVAVVSTNFALRQALGEGCATAGYPPALARDWWDAPAGGPAVWDVPVLEPSWAADLARRSRTGPVVALIGFADRPLVSEARAAGAAACLELPVDLADLVAVLDRLTGPRADPAHQAPPPPASRRRAGAGAVVDSRPGA